MKSWIRALLTTATGILLSAHSWLHADAAQFDDQHFQAYLDGLVAAQFGDYKLAGMAFVLVKDGQIASKAAYGYADIFNRVPVDPDRHLFRPGSVSKLFTWTAVMQLVEQGKLDLDADIAQYVDQFPIPNNFSKPLTLTHLLTHAPGLEDGAAGYLFANREDKLMPLADSLARYTPTQVRPPGTYSAYSNWATALAGLIVANVSGQPFESYVAHHIFAPLGMTQATFEEPLPEKLQRDMAQGYIVKQGGLEAFPFEFVKNFGPAGAMSASASAMAPFMLAHLNEGRYRNFSLLQPQTVTLMHSNLFSHHPSALAWTHGFYEYLRNGQRFITHGGDTIAFHSQLILHLEDKFGFYLTFNTADGGKARQAIVDGVVDYFYPPSTAPNYRLPVLNGSEGRIALISGAYRPTRRSFTKLEGITALAADIQVQPADPGAIVITAGDEQEKLYEVEPFVFVQQGGQRKVVFGTNTDGKVAHLFLGVTVAEKVGFFNQASTHQLVLVLAFLASLFVLINYLRQPKQTLHRAAFWARLTLVGASAANLLFLAGLILVLSDFDFTDAIFDFPPSNMGAVLVFPVLSVAFTVVALVMLPQVWRAADCGVWARLRYTYVTVLFVTLCLVFNYWNLLGWNYY